MLCTLLLLLSESHIELPGNIVAPVNISRPPSPQPAAGQRGTLIKPEMHVHVRTKVMPSHQT